MNVKDVLALFELPFGELVFRAASVHRLHFDPAQVHAPDLHSLPESHMGLYIIRSCVDDVSYRRGDPPLSPNVLTLTKRRVARAAEAGS